MVSLAAERRLRVGEREIPVVLPSLNDPRLHLAVVIISIHVLGQTHLGFRVSVPQILAAIATCAVIEVVITLRSTGRLVWPASAMLTGSGVALILRLVGMERGEHWSWRGWHLFALVAGLSLMSKYLIRVRGSHLFNPSNLGLVVAFAVLGSGVIEPLDFWWAPFGPAMAVAYGLILGGGLLITRRLGLLPMALAFWATLAAGLSLLTLSGHCITAAWALGPVCGAHFWSVVVFSPEVLIFLFFMITDPKTIPETPGGRLVFAAAVAALSTVLIAPHGTEFWAKVGLLAGLVLLTPIRGLFDRLSAVLARSAPARPGRLALAGRGALLGTAVGLLGVAVVVAGVPARGVEDAAAPAPALDAARAPTSLPEVTVSDAMTRLNSAVASDPNRLAAEVVGLLAVQAEAMARSDLALLRTVAAGEYLLEVEAAIESGADAGRLVVPRFELDEIHLDVAYADGPQGGASVAAGVRGMVEEVTYDRAGVELSRNRKPVEAVYALRPEGGGWRIFARLEGRAPLSGAAPDTP